MKEIIAWTVNVWRMYWGNGWIPYLLALGGACALIFGKKKKNSLSLVLYSVFLLVLFFLSVFRTGDYEMYRKNRVLACFVAFTYGSADRRRFYRACPKKSQPDRAGDPGAGFDRSYCCFWDRNDKSRKFRKSL